LNIQTGKFADIAMASSITSNGFITIHDRQIYYEQEGDASKQTVLFVHGLGGTLNTFQPLVASLRAFHLVRFDLSGHGRSSVPSQKTTINTYVDDCKGGSAQPNGFLYLFSLVKVHLLTLH
jgi:alpha-beta hydrolase superfamily lysophospholipase